MSEANKRMNERNSRGLCIHWVYILDHCERCAAGDTEEVVDDPKLEHQVELPGFEVGT